MEEAGRKVGVRLQGKKWQAVYAAFKQDMSEEERGQREKTVAPTPSGGGGPTREGAGDGGAAGHDLELEERENTTRLSEGEPDTTVKAKSKGQRTLLAAAEYREGMEDVEGAHID